MTVSWVSSIFQGKKRPYGTKHDIIINNKNDNSEREKITYPDKERGFEAEREREADLDRDLTGERREGLVFGDLLH